MTFSRCDPVFPLPIENFSEKNFNYPRKQSKKDLQNTENVDPLDRSSGLAHTDTFSFGGLKRNASPELSEVDNKRKPLRAIINQKTFNYDQNSVTQKDSSLITQIATGKKSGRLRNITVRTISSKPKVPCAKCALFFLIKM